MGDTQLLRAPAGSSSRDLIRKQSDEVDLRKAAVNDVVLQVLIIRDE